MFIKVTGDNGKPIFVNMDNIPKFSEYYNNVYMAYERGHGIEVKATVDEILKALED